MAHNLNFNEQTGNYSIFTTKPTWHRLEKQVSNASTSEEAIKLAGLDFQVEKVPLLAFLPNGDAKEFKNKFATIRTDNNGLLGVVGNKYNILQNKQAFTFIDELVGSKQAVFHSAGALGEGESIFLTVKLPESTVIGNETIDNYFCLTNTHDGSRGVRMCFSQILMVCENTVAEAFRTGKRKKRIMHTQSMLSTMHNSAIDMGIVKKKLEEQKEMLTHLTKVKITDERLKELITETLQQKEVLAEDYSTRFKNIVENVYAYTVGAPEQQNEERLGTMFGFWNGITGYYNHKFKHKNDDSKFESLMYGKAREFSEKALQLALN